MIRTKNILAVFIYSIAVMSVARGSLSGAPQTVLGTPPDVGEVKRLLESESAKDQAWGAWWTKESQLKQFAPQIEKNLRAHLTGKELADRSDTDASLDALIQFQSALPADLIEAVYKTDRVFHALVLLQLSTPGPEIDSLVLTVLETEAGQGVGTAWYAAANLMLERHSPGLIASLLGRLQIKGYVTICNPGAATCRHQRIGHGSAGDGASWRTPEYPPWTRYYCQSVGGAPSFSPIASPHPVTCHRQSGIGVIGSLGYRDNQEQDPPNPSTMDRLNYIRAAAPGVTLTIRDDEEIHVYWQDQAAYAATYKSFEADIRARYTKLIDQLKDTGAITSDEAAAFSKPNLNIVVDDQHR